MNEWYVVTLLFHEKMPVKVQRWLEPGVTAREKSRLDQGLSGF